MRGKMTTGLLLVLAAILFVGTALYYTFGDNTNSQQATLMAQSAQKSNRQLETEVASLKEQLASMDAHFKASAEALVRTDLRMQDFVKRFEYLDVKLQSIHRQPSLPQKVNLVLTQEKPFHMSVIYKRASAGGLRKPQASVVTNPPLPPDDEEFRKKVYNDLNKKLDAFKK